MRFLEFADALMLDPIECSLIPLDCVNFEDALKNIGNKQTEIRKLL